MKEFKVLKFLDRFRGLFEKLGVDYPVMRRILQVKLIMDGRRIPTVLGNTKNKDKEENNGFVKSLWIYVLMGGMTAIFLFLRGNYLFKMSAVFAILLFMIMSSLISDFSSVLLDLRDKNIISSKPVGRRTIGFAKTIHVLIYMIYTTAALTAIPLAVSVFRYGVLFALLFLAEIILVDLFIVALTALIYLLVLKFFDGERLRDFINYVQIALALGVTLGYQLVGRLFNLTAAGMVFTPKWYMIFLPPIWFAAPFEVFFKGETELRHLVLSLLAAVIPVVSILLYLKMMPAFERNLQKLSSYGGYVRKGNGKFLERISKAICKSREERLFFRFASDMMRNEREFKLKVYPLLGLSMIMPFIMLLNILNSSGSMNLHGSRTYLFIYFCGMFLPTLMITARCSSNYKGAWIYQTVPIRNLEPVFKGAMKAMIVKLFLPAFCLESVVFLFLYGIEIMPGLIAVLLNILLYTAFCFKRIAPVLPFSKDIGIKQEDEWIGVAVMFSLIVPAGVQVAASFLWYGIYIDIAAAAIACVFLWRKAFKVSWEKINQT